MNSLKSPFISKRWALSLAAIAVTALGVGLLIEQIEVPGVVISALGLVFLGWLLLVG